MCVHVMRDPYYLISFPACSASSAAAHRVSGGDTWRPEACNGNTHKPPSPGTGSWSRPQSANAKARHKGPLASISGCLVVCLVVCLCQTTDCPPCQFCLLFASSFQCATFHFAFPFPSAPVTSPFLVPCHLLATTNITCNM